MMRHMSHRSTRHETFCALKVLHHYGLGSHIKVVVWVRYPTNAGGFKLYLYVLNQF
jgi:hypothetical protein